MREAIGAWRGSKLDGPVDIAIIGGGINGCGIARDAAGRGLSAYLCEMNDLASGTSSWSTKLIHGGLRYLEYNEFRLVREALIEREVLWGIAPHIIRPLRFVLPHRAGMRPQWLLRTGLFLYDHLGGRKKLAPTRKLDLTKDEAGKPLRHGVFSNGFEYSDCFVDDARLVVLNAMSARDLGAQIETRTRAIGARIVDGLWHVETERGSDRRTISARALINAAGPWVDGVLRGAIGNKARAKVRLVQGSHIVLRKLYDHDRAYILQNPDGRIVFAIPYQHDFTLIGTTDRDYHGDPGKVTATPEEIDYLCAAISQNFETAVTPADVVWSYSGVRLLYDDGASEAKAATRDYVFEVDAEGDGPPLLSVFGGKITTYRRLAEAALEKLRPHLLPETAAKLSNKAGWTASQPLPGGDFATGGESEVEDRLRRACPYVDPAFARRLVAAYGTRALTILGSSKRMGDLGERFGGTLTEAEVCYLMQHEWARTAADIVSRRSKLALRMTPSEIDALQAWIDREGAAAG